jgi:hypothetical protein
VRCCFFFAHDADFAHDVAKTCLVELWRKREQLRITGANREGAVRGEIENPRGE